MRRFLPVIRPGLCIALAAAASALWTAHRWRRLARPAAVAALGLVLWHEVTMSRPFWSLREKNGAVRQLAAVASQVPERSLVLFSASGLDTVIATPLAFHWGRAVLPVMGPENDREAVAREGIFKQQVMRLLGEGREVLYLTASDGDSVFVTPRVRWEPLRA